MRFNVFVTKNTWVFSVSRFVSTACTRFLIITLLFLYRNFLSTFFLIIAFLYEIYHWIFSWGVGHCCVVGIPCSPAISCVFSNVRSLPTLTSFSPMFVFWVPITRRSRKILFASSWMHSFTNSLWLVTNWSRVYPSVWKRLWNLYVIYQSRSWFYISFKPSANSYVRKKWNLPVPRPCVFHLSLRVAVW